MSPAHISQLGGLPMRAKRPSLYKKALLVSSTLSLDLARSLSLCVRSLWSSELELELALELQLVDPLSVVSSA